MKTQQLVFTEWAKKYGWNNWMPSSGYYTDFSSGSGYANLGPIPAYNYVLIIKLQIPKIVGKTESRKLLVDLGFADYAGGTVYGCLSPRGKETHEIPEADKDDVVNTSFYRPINSNKATLTFNLGNKFNSEETCYLWLGADLGYDSASGSKLAGVWVPPVIRLEYEDYAPVISPEVASSSRLIASQSSLNVSWVNAIQSNNEVDVINNAIQIRRNAADGTVLYENLTLGASTSSHTITWNDYSIKPKGGDELYAVVWAIGEYEGTNGSKNSAKVAKVNTVPGAPTLTSTPGEKVSTSQSITFNLVPGSDPDDQTLSLGYSLKEGEILPFTGNSFQLTGAICKNNELAVGNHEIRFYTHDGLEWSSERLAYTFYVSYKPVINSANVTLDTVKSMDGKNDLFKEIKIEIKLSSGRAEEAKLYIDSTLVGAGIYSYNNSTNVITLNYKGLTDSLVARGSSFKLSLRAVDGNEESDLYSINQTLYRADKLTESDIQLPTIISDKKSGFEAPDFQFGKYVKIGTATISNKSFCPKIKNEGRKVKATVGTGDTAKVYESAENIDFDLTQVGTGENVVFSFEVTDELDQILLVEYPNEWTRAASLAWPQNGDYALNYESFKPHTNLNDQLITHPKLGEKIQYSYYLEFNGGSKKLASSPKEDFSSDVTLKSIVARNEINSQAKSLAQNGNSVYVGTIKIVAENAFYEVPYSLNITIDFVEAPSFQSGSNFYLKHIQSTDQNGSEMNISGNNHKVFPDEWLVFYIPQAFDYNNDIQSYEISIKCKEDEHFNRTIILNKDALDNNGYTHKLQTSHYTTDLTFNFSVRPKDSLNNYGEPLQSQYGIIGCRMEAPVFEISDIVINSNKNLEFNYNISDYGFTKNNLLARNEKDFGFKIQIANDMDFSNPEEITSSLISNGDIPNNGNKSLTISSNATKLYLRFLIETKYTNGGIVTSAPYSYTYFFTTPTVAYRKNGLGINTEILEDDGILTIKNFEGKDKIYLIGDRTITIDLTNRTISGLTINGGSW